MHIMDSETERQYPWQEKFLFFSQLTLVITAFCLPLSTTATNVLFPLAVLFSLFSNNFLHKLSKLLRNPVALSLAFFFLLYVIGSFYTTASYNDLIRQFTKTSCFLFAALLIPTLRDQRWNRYAIDAFLLAMLLTLILSYIKYFFDPPLFHNRFNNASIFKDHIVQNFLMAFATFIFLYRWLHRYPYRWIYGLIVLAATYNVLFMSTGRSGYFVFAALLLYTLIAHFGWKGLRIALLSLCLLFGLAYLSSPDFKIRMSTTVTNLLKYQQGHHHSSIGIRIQSLKNASTLYKHHPFFGHGTASFRSAYLTLPHQATQTTGIMKVSYNSYLNVAVELGMIGLLFLLLMLFIQWHYSFQLAPDLQYVLQALLIGMMLGCLANPWLSDTTELRLYTLFLAITFSTLALPHKKKSSVLTAETTRIVDNS